MNTTAANKSTTTTRSGKQTAAGPDTARRTFLVAAANMSWQLAIVVILPIVGGAQLDKYLGSGSVWTLIGVAVAFILSTAIIWRTVQQANRLPVPKLTEAERRKIQKSYEEDDDE